MIGADDAAETLFASHLCEAAFRLPPGAAAAAVPFVQLAFKFGRPRSAVWLGAGSERELRAACACARAYQTETIVFAVGTSIDADDLRAVYPPARVFRDAGAGDPALFPDAALDLLYVAPGAAFDADGVSAVMPWLPKLSRVACVIVGDLRTPFAGALWRELARRFPVRVEIGGEAHLGIAATDPSPALAHVLTACACEPRYRALVDALCDHAAALIDERQRADENAAAAEQLAQVRAYAQRELALTRERLGPAVRARSDTVDALFRLFLRRAPIPVERAQNESVAASGTSLGEVIAAFDALPEFRGAPEWQRLVTYLRLSEVVGNRDPQEPGC